VLSAFFVVRAHGVDGRSDGVQFVVVHTLILRPREVGFDRF
jgi:hypothetical protein